MSPEKEQLKDYRLPFGPHEGLPLGDVAPAHLVRLWRQAHEFLFKVYAFFETQGYQGLNNEKEDT